MGKVYRSAALTIAAVASRDGSGGLFRDLNPLGITKCLLSKGWHFPYVKLYIDPMTRSRKRRQQVEDIHRSKWLQRGWTLQEQVLSQRIVYFGHDGSTLR